MPIDIEPRVFTINRIYEMAKSLLVTMRYLII